MGCWLFFSSLKELSVLACSVSGIASVAVMPEQKDIVVFKHHFTFIYNLNKHFSNASLFLRQMKYFIEILLILHIS